MNLCFVPEDSTASEEMRHTFWLWRTEGSSNCQLPSMFFRRGPLPFQMFSVGPVPGVNLIKTICDTFHLACQVKSFEEELCVSMSTRWIVANSSPIGEVKGFPPLLQSCVPSHRILPISHPRPHSEVRGNGVTPSARLKAGWSDFYICKCCPFRGRGCRVKGDGHGWVL